MKCISLTHLIKWHFKRTKLNVLSIAANAELDLKLSHCVPADYRRKVLFLKIHIILPSATKDTNKLDKKLLQRKKEFGGKRYSITRMEEDNSSSKEIKIARLVEIFWRVCLFVFTSTSLTYSSLFCKIIKQLYYYSKLPAILHPGHSPFNSVLQVISNRPIVCGRTKTAKCRALY